MIAPPRGDNPHIPELNVGFHGRWVGRQREAKVKTEGRPGYIEQY